MRGKAQHVAHLVQMLLQNSGITGPKFAKFLLDVDGSLAVLRCASILRSSHLLWNTSTLNEGGVCQFLLTRAKNRLLITIATFHERLQKGRIDHAHPYVYIS